MDNEKKKWKRNAEINLSRRVAEDEELKDEVVRK